MHNLSLHRDPDLGCPHCNAVLSSLSLERKHCNGSRTENYTFSCGYRMEWSANYSDWVPERVPCPRTEAGKQLERERALEQAKAVYQKLDDVGKIYFRAYFKETENDQ